MYSALRSAWHSMHQINMISYFLKINLSSSLLHGQLLTTHTQHMSRLTDYNRAQRKQPCLGLALKPVVSLPKTAVVSIQPRSSQIHRTLCVSHPWLTCAICMTLLRRRPAVQEWQYLDWQRAKSAWEFISLPPPPPAITLQLPRALYPMNNQPCKGVKAQLPCFRLG